MPLYHLSDRFR